MGMFIGRQGVRGVARAAVMHPIKIALLFAGTVLVTQGAAKPLGGRRALPEARRDRLASLSKILKFRKFP